MKQSQSEGHPLDLKLLCANNDSVLVCCQLLRDATRNAAVKDIIDMALTDARADTPKELPVTEDSAEVWRVVWNLIKHPMLTKGQGLERIDIRNVIKLADKYDLVSVLQSCDAFILIIIADRPTIDDLSTPFGLLKTEVGCSLDLDLPLLELLSKVHMWNACDALTPQYVRLLRSCCKDLIAKRKALVKLLLDKPEGRHLSKRVEESRLSAEATYQIQAMNADLGSFRGSASDPQLAARVVGAVQEQMAQVLSELALSVLSV